MHVLVLVLEIPDREDWVTVLFLRVVGPPRNSPCGTHNAHPRGPAIAKPLCRLVENDSFLDQYTAVWPQLTRCHNRIRASGALIKRVTLQLRKGQVPAFLSVNHSLKFLLNLRNEIRFINNFHSQGRILYKIVKRY